MRTSRTLPSALGSLSGGAGHGQAATLGTVGGRMSGATTTPAGEGVGAPPGVPLIVTTGPAAAPPAQQPMAASLAAARIPQRLSRLDQLRAAVASHGPGSELGMSTHALRETTNEDRMAHGPYELSYLEFLEVRTSMF